MTAILPTNRAGVVTADTIRQAGGGKTRPGREPHTRRTPTPLPTTPPATATAKQVAAWAGVTPSMVQKWVAGGLLTARKVGGGRGRFEFDGDEAVAFVRRRLAQEGGTR